MRGREGEGRREEVLTPRGAGRSRPARSSDRPGSVAPLGVGVGLRPVHYPEVLERSTGSGPRPDYFEAISENFMIPGGRPLRVLEQVRASYPLVLHGVSLNVGSSDPLDESYLDALAALCDRFEPAFVSDHLCWTGRGGRNLHDLLPLPLTEEVMRYTSERVLRVQDRLRRRIALENVSSYAAFVYDEMPEWEFLAGIAERADCGILLDVNNVFVSAHNHGFDSDAYVAAIPASRVVQIHLAGHRDEGPIWIDTHDRPIREEVLALYERTLRLLGPVPTLVEWDDAIPSYDDLLAEADRARRILDRVSEADPRRGATHASAAAAG